MPVKLSSVARVMMNMSKLIPGQKQESCKTWQAPSFGSASPHTGTAGLRTREQSEQHRKQAYDEGFAQGHRDGMQQAQQQIHEKVSCLESVLGMLSSPLEELDEQVISELGELAMLVAGQIVRRELKTSPGEVVATVKEALSLLPVAAGKTRLELHPDDAATVREALSGVDMEHSWDIVEDPLLTRGGCRISTSTSRIDATVEGRLNAAIASVMGSERKTEQPT